MADPVHPVCGVGIERMWVAAGPYRSTGGCHSSVRYVQLIEDEIRMNMALLVAMKSGGVRKCEVTDVLDFSKEFYLSAGDREMKFIRRVFRRFWVDLLVGGSVHGVRAAKFRHYSLDGQSVIAGCSAVRDVEQLLQRP